MENLCRVLDEHILELTKKSVEKIDLSEAFLNNLYSVFPFNRFEYVISHLIANEIVDIEQYLEIRNSYLDRNKYLYLFEISAPRKFGETWAQNHLKEIVPELHCPSKKYDDKYTGQYDFWFNGIRIEVKASRAVDSQSDEPLVIKALSTKSKKNFNMNFQQIKTDCCDVLVWIGVWRDEIKHWVISSDEVKNNPFFSIGQHRGNIGEGQLWLTEKNIESFAQYLVKPRDLLEKIIAKAK